MYSKVDFTAWFVLQGLLAAAHQPEFLGKQDIKLLHLRDILAKSAAETRFISKIIYKLPYKLQYRIGQLATDKTRMRHFLLRKNEIACRVHKILSGGDIKQMVVLGSGLDVLPLSIANDFPQVQFIEIDLEATQSFKQQVFAKNGLSNPANVTSLIGDLRNPLAEILSNSQFQSGTPTLWLAEGLLMFLPESAVQTLLTSVHSLSGKESKLIFTTLSINEDTDGNYRIQQFFLRKEKIPFQWTIAEDKVADFVQSLGYNVITHIPYSALHENYLATDGMIPRMTENITLAVL